jgi:protein-tyrosine phosphatase
MLEGQPNFRDLGGTPANDGRRIRHGVLYRSGELSTLGDDDRRRLGSLSLGSVVDLRSEAEVSERGADRLPDGVTLVRLPLAQADRLQALLSERFRIGRFDPPEGDLMVDVYRDLVGSWMPVFRSFIDLLVDGDLPAVVHCTHGKDRAGVASALVLAALGVDRTVIEADFLASNARRAAENAERMDQIRALAADRAGDGGPGPNVEWMRAFFVVEPRYLDAAWDEIDRRYGSVSAMFEPGLGLDAVRIARLRDRLLA